MRKLIYKISNQGKNNMAGSSFKYLKRRGVMEAVVKVMTRQGMEGFSMDDVAAEAGVSKGTLYNYFSTKEELMKASIENTMEPLEEELDRLFKSTLSPIQKIQYMTNRFLSYFDSKGEFFRVLLFVRESGQIKYQKYHSDRYRNFLKRMAGVLEDGMNLGQIKELDPMKTAAIILESNISLISQRLLLEDPGPVEADAELVTEIIMRGITGEGAA
jgi:AcrR family transcriptional regulator